MKRRFRRDIRLDAMMVMAIRANLLERFAIGAGLSPNEVFARKEWLPKQSRQYLHAVEMEVNRIAVSDIADTLS